jgi:hypothetical protein
MFYPKKNYETDNYSDYYAKCSICEAEVFSLQRAAAYLSTLNSLLSRMPKLMETIKIYGLETPTETKPIEKTFSLLDDIVVLRNMINSMQQDVYNEDVRARCKEQIRKHLEETEP